MGIDWSRYRNGAAAKAAYEAAKAGAAGAVSIATSTLGINRAPDDVIDTRRDLCMQCEHMHGCLGDRVHCCGRLSDFRDPSTPTCGCVIEAKIKLATTSCPVGRWSRSQKRTI